MSQLSTFSPTISPGTGPVFTLTGNSGGAVGPDGAGNINIVGTGTITVVDNPGTNTLTITPSGTIASSFVTNSGTATPVAGVLNVYGESTSILSTTGSGNTVTVDMTNGTNGQVLIGGGTGAAWETITSTGGTITFTPGANSLNMEVTNPYVPFTWHDVTGGAATLAANNGYIADSASLTTFTMPTNNAFGNTILVVGKGSGGWKIVYTTGQNIIFGSSASTATTGNIASTNANDCVTLICTTASATAPIFTVTNSVGNISIT